MDWKMQHLAYRNFRWQEVTLKSLGRDKALIKT